VDKENMGLFGRIFGKKGHQKLLDPVDLSILGVDIHSHLIPGIDDGAQTMEDSIALLREFQELGFKKVVTTPHVMSDYYKNTPEIILSGLENVRRAMVKEGLTIEIDAAAEYNLDADFEQLVEHKNLLTFGDNYVLFELPFFQEPQILNSIIWKMKSAGYQPVLAHVERYSFWHKNLDKIEELHDRGVLIQLNINSLTGHYGPDVKKTGEWLVNEKRVDLVGSDCHNLNHMNLLKHARQFPSVHKVVEFPNLINKKLIN
jgi:protein-tyrosine phosphatase